MTALIVITIVVGWYVLGLLGTRLLNWADANSYDFDEDDVAFVLFFALFGPYLFILSFIYWMTTHEHRKISHWSFKSFAVVRILGKIAGIKYDV